MAEEFEFIVVGGGILSAKLLQLSRVGDGGGMLATCFAEVTGFLRLAPESPKPEIQYYFVFAIALDHGRDIHAKHGMSSHTVLLHPKSRATVKLASADFRDAPLLDFNYLSHPDDLAQLVEGSKRVRRALQTGHCRTDADWIEVVRKHSGTVYHPVGSCKMGNDAAAVVDARLKVIGLQGLRVVDSSIMPTIPGGNTRAPAMMVAEKRADMIREDRSDGGSRRNEIRSSPRG